MKIKWSEYKWLGFIIVFTAIAYLPLLGAFFQQDEWLAFGRHLVIARESWESLIYNTFLVPGGHFNPLNFILIHLFFKIFQLNFVAYALVSIFFHLLVITGVFFLAREITKSAFVANTSALFFGVFASHSQASTWVVADISTHGATLLGIISLICFYKYLLIRKENFFILSILFLLISLMLKEVTIGLLPLYLTILILDKKNHFKRRYKLSTVVLVGGLYVFFRIFISSGTDFYGNQVDFGKRIDRLFYNSLTIPYKSIIQGVISPDLQVNVSYWLSDFIPGRLTGIKNTPEFNMFVEKKVFEVLSFVIFLVIFFIFLYFFKKLSKTFKLALTLYLITVIFCSFIFVFAPEKNGVINIIDSRNLYFLNVFTVIVLATLVKHTFSHKPFFQFMAIILIAGVNLLWLEIKLLNIKHTGEIKKDILKTIKNTYPNVSSPMVFYTEGDKALYGLPENQKILPFQSGLGQTLLIWYSTNNYIPSAFFKNRFLWEITEEGFKDIEGVGFGYFRNFENMAKVLIDKDIENDKVFAFRYNSESQILKDITPQIRQRIEGFKASKREIKLNPQLIETSENSDQAVFLADSDTQTAWSSNNPYKVRQRILIELDVEYNLAQIDIFSKNKDQNKVGIKILVSDDSRIWKEVFLSQNVDWYENKTSLYLEPIRSRYLKILQIGHHDYAKWVVDEIKIYEAISK